MVKQNVDWRRVPPNVFLNVEFGFEWIYFFHLEPEIKIYCMKIGCQADVRSSSIWDTHRQGSKALLK